MSPARRWREPLLENDGRALRNLLETTCRLGAASSYRAQSLTCRKASLSQATGSAREGQLQGADVRLLAVQTRVQARFFNPWFDADGGDAVDKPEHRVGEHERPDRGADDRRELLE